MPEIATAMPLQPSVPQALAGVAPTAPTAPGSAGADPGMPNADFLGQLKAALRSLAGVVSAMPAGAAPAQVVVAAATLISGTDQPAPLAKADDQKPAEVEADLAQVVAALGLVVTPPPINVDPTTDIHGTTAAPAKDAKPGPLTPVTPTPVPQQALTASGDVAKTATPDAATSAATVDPAKTGTSNSIDVSGLSPVPPMTPGQPSHVSADAIAAAASAQVNTTANQAPLAAPQTHQSTTQPVTAPVTAPLTGQPAAPVLEGEGGSAHHHGDGATREESATPVSAASPAPDHTFAAVAESAVPTSSNMVAQPAVHPGEVVSQIAHQADLYRLPGNKGVRIQLHPEDLGGVQVTVRYAAGGGLELHIAVEHASTGALVQAGWSELRDALTTQGFSPDRLVMSVSATGNSSQLDFSSNGGNGYRSDAGAANGGFASGGQSGQRRDRSDPDGLFSATGWTSDDDVSTASETASRTTGVGAPSRIDYRV